MKKLSLAILFGILFLGFIGLPEDVFANTWISLVKQTVGGDGTFDIEIINPTDGTQNHLLTTFNGHANIWKQIPSGELSSLSETVPAGWTLIAKHCNINTIFVPGNSTDISPSSGDGVYCKFTNALTAQTVVIPSATGTGDITLTISSGTFTQSSAVSESSLPVTGKPSIPFPHGLVSWTAAGLSNGETISIDITYPDPIPTGAQYWKVINGAWVDVTSLLSDDDGDNLLTLTIQDGGLGDADGLANGTIEDPGGVGIVYTCGNTGSPNLLVSAPDPQSIQYLTGPDVMTVQVCDYDILATDEAKGEPDVTVNGKILRMIQADDGDWYAYLAVRAEAQQADSISSPDFGEFCDETSDFWTTAITPPPFADADGVALHGPITGSVNGNTPITGTCSGTVTTPNVSTIPISYPTINTNANVPSGQIGLAGDNWPLIQLYDLAKTGNVVVQYNKGGNTQTNTWTYDDLPTSSPPSPTPAYSCGIYNNSPNLLTSAPDPLNLQYLTGPDVMTVRICDSNISDTTQPKGEPDVTANGKILRMIQADDGDWYAYLAVRAEAQQADALPNPDFGEFCGKSSDLSSSGTVTFTDTDGIAVYGQMTGSVNGNTPITGTCSGTVLTGTSTAIASHPTINTNANVPSGQIGLDGDNWPLVQLYDFQKTGNVVIQYNQGGSVQTNTWTYDDLPTPSFSQTVQSTGSVSGSVIFSNSHGGPTSLTAVDPATISNLPSGVTFPYGLFDFVWPVPNDGDKLVLLIEFPGPAPASYWKLINGAWQDVSTNTNTDGSPMVSVDTNPNVLILQIIDGGFGDLDNFANSSVSDPSGPGLPAHDILIPFGTAVPGCENTNSCFTPYSIQVSPGDTVTWLNDDHAAHTIWEGNSNNPSMLFASEILMYGDTFSHTFVQSGVFPFFDAIHPWANGEVIVTGSTNYSGPSSYSGPTPYSTFVQPTGTTDKVYFHNHFNEPDTLTAITPADAATMGTGFPSGNSFPYGLFDFTYPVTSGDKLILFVEFPTPIPTPLSYWKLINGAWQDVSTNTNTDGSPMVSVDTNPNVLILQIIDGGFGDLDNSVNNLVSDPSGLGISDVPKEPIPGWIKNNAGWWADDSIDDDSFVQGLQFLIKEDILKVPPTTQGSSSGTSKIPAWIENNAGWWADGSIDDDSFVQGIQFLIEKGIMKVN